MHPAVDLSFYQETQLDDAEIVEREVVRQKRAERDTLREHERQRHMRNFRFKSGML